MIKDGYVGKYHYGREKLFSAHTSSAVVPKGSPIKVNIYQYIKAMQQSLNSNLLFRMYLTRISHGWGILVSLIRCLKTRKGLRMSVQLQKFLKINLWTWWGKGWQADTNMHHTITLSFTHFGIFWKAFSSLCTMVMRNCCIYDCVFLWKTSKRQTCRCVRATSKDSESTWS